MFLPLREEYRSARWFGILCRGTNRRPKTDEGHNISHNLVTIFFPGRNKTLLKALHDIYTLCQSLFESVFLPLFLVYCFYDNDSLLVCQHPNDVGDTTFENGKNLVKSLKGKRNVIDSRAHFYYSHSLWCMPMAPLKRRQSFLENRSNGFSKFGFHLLSFVTTFLYFQNNNS